VIAIAASTGGPHAIRHVLRSLPYPFPAAVLVVQHMPEAFIPAFAARLDRSSALAVHQAQDGDRLEAGCVYIAPGGSHMRLRVRQPDGGLEVALEVSAPVHGMQPSADVLFESVASCAGGRAIGVVLTGMGTDGTAGIRALKRSGASTVAQDAATSAVYGMPRSALETGCIDRVLPLSAIPDVLRCMAKDLHDRLAPSRETSRDE
jgi:two-component system chemotaxis response regulator CheB